VGGRFIVSEQKLHDELRPSDEEINALLAEPYTFSFQSVRASLNKRSTLFKYTWITLMAITTLYLMGWFTGLIKPFMAASASGLEADYQLHQDQISARIYHACGRNSGSKPMTTGCAKRLSSQHGYNFTF
jgi:hypothetical protein